MDDAPEASESAKLVTEAFANLPRLLCPDWPILLGEGMGLSLDSRALLMLICLGLLEKSFILDL